MIHEHNTLTVFTDCYNLLTVRSSHKILFKKGLILIGRCRIVRMICVDSLKYASEEEKEEEEETNEKIVVEEEKKEEEEKNTTKKRINKMYNKKLCPSVEHLVEFLYVLY